MQILREIVFRRCVNIRKITPASSGYENFLTDLMTVLDEKGSPTPLTRLNSTHESSSTTSYNDHIPFLIHLATIITSPDFCHGIPIVVGYVLRGWSKKTESETMKGNNYTRFISRVSSL